MMQPGGSTDAASDNKRIAQLEGEVTRLKRELLAATGKPLARASIDEREALLKEAERVAHMGSWTWDPQTNEISWSQEMFSILGYGAEEVPPSAERFFDAIHPLDRERVKAVAEEGLQNTKPKPVEFRLTQADGTLRQVRMEAGVVLRPGKKGPLFVGTVLDQTDRRRQETLLARAVDELTRAQEIARLGSWYWDRSENRLEWSAGLSHLLEHPITEPPSFELLFSMISPDEQDAVRKHFAAAQEGHCTQPIECNIQQDTSTLLVRIESSPHYDGAGSLLGFHGVLQDVTEQRSQELQLREAQKMEAIGRLAGGVAHDFNNYLTVLAGHADLLREFLTEDEPCMESVDAILDVTERCALLTKQLLTFSRTGRPALDSLDLKGILDALTPVLQSMMGETIELELDFDESPAIILGDRTQIEQVIVNLCINARDAMPSGGRLRLAVDTELSNGAEGPVSKGSMVRLTVEDTGCGIPKEFQPRMFEPFATTKALGKGTGLGLATVYGVVKKVGGSIEVESEVGQGTAFIVRLPRGRLSQIPEELPPSAAYQPTHQRVLLVEDVPQVRDLLARQLERSGYRVLCASDGADALTLLKTESVDLVLSDVVMPKVGGIELATQLGQRQPPIPCVLMTGYSEQTADPNVETGAVCVLQKPFTLRQLLRSLPRG